MCVCICVQRVSLPSQLDRARGQGVLSECHLLRTSHPAAVSGALGCLWTRRSAQGELVFVRPSGLRGTHHHKPMKHTALLSAHRVCSPGLLGCGLGRLPGCPEPQFPQGQPREQVLSEEASWSLQEELRLGRQVAATSPRTSSTGWTSSCQGPPGPGTALHVSPWQQSHRHGVAVCRVPVGAPSPRLHPAALSRSLGTSPGASHEGGPRDTLHGGWVLSCL